MDESGPVKRPNKTSEGAFEFSDIERLAPHIWRVTVDGRYWLLKSPKAEDTASRVLLRREYEIARKLQHPYIASSFFYLDESPVGEAIMMEYVQGRTLANFVAMHPSRAMKRKVLGQVLDAVEYLHAQGLLHNDLKPDNVMVTTLGSDVKIIDFGFSESEADYLNRHLGGTPGFSAPEVMEPDASAPSSASSDIYSLGAIIRMLFPKRYRGIVKKCRHADARRRFPDVPSLRRALARADRAPVLIAVLLLVAALAGAALIPDAIRERQARSEQEMLDANVGQIQQDMEAFYRQAADELADGTKVPDRDSAIPVRSAFVEKVAAYRESLSEQEMRFACDTIYMRLITSLNEIVAELPQ